MTGKVDRKVKVRGLAAKPAGKSKSRHLFDHWEEVQRRLANSNDLALFLDFDGTITPLCPNPSDVKLKESTRAVLRRLASHPSITLCFISGRRRAELRKLVNVRRALYVGLHGWERGAEARSAVAAPDLLAHARLVLAEKLSGLRHVRVGDKGPCFDVHFHGASDATIRKGGTRHSCRKCTSGVAGPRSRCRTDRSSST